MKILKPNIFIALNMLRLIFLTSGLSKTFQHCRCEKSKKNKNKPIKNNTQTEAKKTKQNLLYHAKIRRKRIRSNTTVYTFSISIEHFSVGSRFYSTK